MKNPFFTWTEKKKEVSKLKGDLDVKIILDPEFSLGDLEIPEPVLKRETTIKPKIIEDNTKGKLF